jgi:hypothetical protein
MDGPLSVLFNAGTSATEPSLVYSVKSVDIYKQNIFLSLSNTVFIENSWSYHTSENTVLLFIQSLNLHLLPRVLAGSVSLVSLGDFWRQTWCCEACAFVGVWWLRDHSNYPGSLIFIWYKPFLSFS